MRLFRPCPHLLNPEEAASLAAPFFHRSMTSTADGAAATLRARLALDPRALAVLRAGLGLLLALDAGLRLCAAGTLYADAGVLPRAMAVELLAPMQWSLHLANGSAPFAYLVALAQLVAALGLLVGWRSRASGALLWVLVVSAFTRHPAVVGAADALALALLTLGLFLPWSARWSVDAALAPEPDHAGDVRHPWTELALRAYVALLVALLAALDTGGGLAGLLASEHANALGRALAAVGPGLLDPLGTALRVVAVLVLPLALWPAWWAGRAAALLTGLLALSGLLLLHAGALPWLGLLVAALFGDGALWDRLAGRTDVPMLRLHFDRHAAGAASLARLLRTFLCLPRTAIGAAQDDPRSARLLDSGAILVVIDRDEQAHLDRHGIAILLRRSPLLRPLRALLGTGLGPMLAGAVLALRRTGARLHRIGTDRTSGCGCTRGAAIVAVALGVALAVSSASAAGVLPRVLGRVAGIALQPVGLDRAWIELLPVVDGAQRWITVVGERVDGGEVDATDDALRSADYAPRTPPWFAAAHARAYERSLARGDAGHAVPRALARFLCDRHGAALSRVRVTLMVRDAGAHVAEQRVLLRHECRPDDMQ